MSNGLAVTLAPPDFPGLAPIQPGTFQMGSDAADGAPTFGEFGCAKPVHPVTISRPFWMARHEVTQAQYQALSATVPPWGWIGADLPADLVSWFEALAYCDALTDQQTALGRVPAGYEYRLPTESEWEYACRAGTTTEFHYGAELHCSQAKFAYSFHSTPGGDCNNPLGQLAVGSYGPNAWGLHDMHGNVSEWCLDSFSLYTAAPKTDPFVTGNSFRVVLAPVLTP